MSIDFSWDSIKNNIIRKHSDAEPYISPNAEGNNNSQFTKGFITLKTVSKESAFPYHLVIICLAG